MFSKDQAWSYDRPKVQVWPLLRRTHQAVLFRYDQAQEDQNVQGDHPSGIKDATCMIQFWNPENMWKPFRVNSKLPENHQEDQEAQ